MSIKMIKKMIFCILCVSMLAGCKRYVCSLMSAYQSAILVTTCTDYQWYHAWSDVYDRGATIAHVDVVYNMSEEVQKNPDYSAAAKLHAETIPWFVLWGPHGRDNALLVKQHSGANMSPWTVAIQYDDQSYTVKDVSLVDELTPWHVQLFGCRYTQFRDVYCISIPQDINKKILKAHHIKMRFESFCYASEVILC